MSFRKRTPNGQGLGWRAAPPDHRDALYTYSAPLDTAHRLPDAVEPLGYPVWDQGQLGSCTGNGIAFIALVQAVNEGLLQETDIISRLMIYYLEREREDTVNEDAGADIRDGLKVLKKYGACLESGQDSWPYDPQRFRFRPPVECFKAALSFQALSYHKVPQNTSSLRASIAEGHPVVFGFVCYSALDSDAVAKTGILPMPKPGEADIGGHCVVLEGYDNSRRMFIVRNSWGKDWGDQGYMYMPYEYVIRPDLSSDFFMIGKIG